MTRWLLNLLVFAVVLHLSALIPARAGEADDEEAQAQKEARERELKNKKAADARKDAEVAKPDPAKGKVTPPAAPKKAAELPVPAANDADVCKECRGQGIVPNSPYKSYYRIVTDVPPTADPAPPWKPCPVCQKDTDIKSIVEDMKARQERAIEKHPEFEKKAGKKLTLVLTPFVAVHTNLPTDKIKTVATELEHLADILQKNSKSMVLMTTRPDTDDLVLLNDEATYNAYVDAAIGPNEDKSMFKKGTGFSNHHFQVFKVSNPQVPPQSPAVYGFGGLLIKFSTEFKAKPWLVEGFQTYSENVTLNSNLNYSFAYDFNTVKFGKNWNVEVRNYAAKGQLKPWDDVFKLDLIGMKALDYLTCYSIASCLIKVDAGRFDKVVLNIKNGDDSATGIERAYGRKIAELQRLWLQWAATQK